MHEQNVNINKVQKRTEQILELKNSITKLKNSPEGFNYRTNQAKESVNLETSHLKLLSWEQKEQRITKRVESIRDLWAVNKWTDICSTRELEGEEGREHV